MISIEDDWSTVFAEQSLQVAGPGKPTPSAAEGMILSYATTMLDGAPPNSEEET